MVIALSGGVDSAVAAAILVKQGYGVTGIHLHLWNENCDTQKVISKTKNKKDQKTFHLSHITYHENKCCNTESLEAARKTAFQLGIPFHILNFEDIFKKTVVKSFLDEYGEGQTPNPCVICNKKIKFGALLEYVRAMGFEYLATGHYVRLIMETQKLKVKSQNHNSKVKTWHLLAGIDNRKDQSYFLYHLTQDQLAHLLFPLGGYTKPEVRKLAEKYNLPSAKRPESQEICFFAEKDYRPFLERNMAGKIRPGKVVDTGGNIIGRHRGLPLYTIGQRHGFAVGEKLKAQNSKCKANEKDFRLIPPFYVIRKDVKKNQLVVGFGKETEVKEFGVKGVNWIQSNEKLIMNNRKTGLFVRIRHGGALLNVKRQEAKGKSNEVRIILEEAQRGISPGQSAVIYKKFKINNEKLKMPGKGDMEVVGGGIIC